MTFKARWRSHAGAVSLVVAAALVLSSCQLFRDPTVTASDVVGAWQSDQFTATLVLRDDMTFDIQDVPIGYIDLSAVDVLDPQTARQERLSFSGTWELDPPDDTDFSYQSLWLLCDTIRPGLSAEVNFRFSGDRIDHVLLTQGDPDSQDFLKFFAK